MRHALALLAILFLGSQAAQAVQLEEKWHGAAYTQEGSCPQFDIFISFVADKIQGKGMLLEEAYEIEGDLGKDGGFVGRVEYFSIAFAELKGDMGSSSGHGQWRTFKGPECAGTFEVTKL